MHNINPVIILHTVGSASCNHPKAATWSLAALCAGHWDILGLNGKRFYCREKRWMIQGGITLMICMNIYIYIQIHIVYSIYIYVCGGIKQTATILGKTWRDVLFLQFLCLGLVIELAPDNGWLGEDPFLSGPDLFGRVETQSKKAA